MFNLTLQVAPDRPGPFITNVFLAKRLQRRDNQSFLSLNGSCWFLLRLLKKSVAKPALSTLVGFVLVLTVAETSCGPESLDAFLARQGYTLVQQPASDLRSGRIFGYFYSSTRDWAGMREAPSGVAPELNVPFTMGPEVWTGYTSFFRLSPEFAVHYILAGVQVAELRALGVTAIHVSLGPGRSAHVNASDVQAALCTAAAADPELEVLAELIPASQPECRKSFVMLSSIQSEAIRLFFTDRRSRRLALSDETRSHVGQALHAEVIVLPESVIEIRRVFVVAANAVGRAFVSASDGENRACRLTESAPVDPSRDLLGGAAAESRRHAGGALGIQVITGQELLAVKKASCLP